MIVGTAGHIDHGKSTLVRALTGVDTDRLPEEKARGISIDLGYAYLAEPGVALGFIDVPGHERFVHTMLAGAAGIDYALLVIAADDGVMPQTREHLAILELLGVQRGRAVVTKSDRVDPERVVAVQAEVHALLAQGSLAGSPVDVVAAHTGAGVPELRAALLAEARALPTAIGQQGFRLAVDRSFVLGGLGTVVTGTVFSGRVQVGDMLETAPHGHAVRVRSLHAQNQVAEFATTGMRCALQITGVQKDQVTRGDWIVAAPAQTSTTRFDACIRLLPGEARALKHWTPVHLHLGAAHTPARVALLRDDDLQPGEETLVQIVTDRPLGCWHGDRFVLRDQSARRTIAGGQVIDPQGWPRHRRSPVRLEMLRVLQLETVQARVAGLLALAPAGVDLDALERSFNQPLDAVLDGLPQVQRVRHANITLAFGAGRWQALRALLAQAVEQFHGQFPGELGPSPARLKRIACPTLGEPAFLACLQDLLASGALARSGAWLHLPGHRVALTAAQQALVALLEPLLQAGTYDPPWVRDLAAATRTAEAETRAVLLALARQGRVFQVVKDLFYTSRNIGVLAELARTLEARHGAVRAAEFRDATGLGRKRAIQILEFFDRVGYTRRVHDDHRLRGDSLFAVESGQSGI